MIVILYSLSRWGPEDFIADDSAPVSIVAFICMTILTTPFAVAWHRLLLLGPASIKNSFGLRFLKRECLFIGTWIMIVFLGIIAYMAASMVLSIINLGILGPILASVLILMLLASYCMVFPLLSIDGQMSAEDASNLATGNMFRLFLLLAATLIGLGFLFDALDWIARSSLEGLGFETAAELLEMGLLFLQFFVFAAIFAGILSLSYIFFKTGRVGVGLIDQNDPDGVTSVISPPESSDTPTQQS